MPDDELQKKYHVQDDLLHHLESEAEKFFAKPDIYTKVATYDEESDILIGALLTLVGDRLGDMSSKDSSFDVKAYITQAFDAVTELYLQKKAQGVGSQKSKNDTTLH